MEIYEKEYKKKLELKQQSGRARSFDKSEWHK
jgi:hypothetical protein